MLITDISHIDRQQWQQLVHESPVATWFQTPEAYDFFASLPQMMTPFVVAVSRPQTTVINTSFINTSFLKGIIVGYVTYEKNPIKQFFTRRAIIYGGLLLADDITDDELRELLSAVTSQLPIPNPHGFPSLQGRGRGGSLSSFDLRLSSFNLRLSTNPIYLETRNFNDYSRWRKVFEQCGFTYQPHLNFHVDCSSLEKVNANLGKNRKRDIRVSLRDGAEIITDPSLEQVKEYYIILNRLYSTKVKTPLPSFDFFRVLFSISSSHFLLVRYGEKIIGGTICVGIEGKGLYEWYVCGIDGEFKTIFPSELATYAGLEYAANNGYKIFDMMGAGTPDEHYGVRDFKARFGGQLVEHGRYIYVSNKVLYEIGKIGVKLMKKI